jgi:hypothetical protein
MKQAIMNEGDVKNKRKYVAAIERSHNTVGIPGACSLDESLARTPFTGGRVAERRRHEHFRLCLA